MQKIIAFDIDYSEIEELILKYFDVKYEIMPEEEIGSSQYAAYVKYNVTPNQFCFDFYCLQDFLNGLCFLGVIEAGTYFVSVSW